MAKIWWLFAQLYIVEIFARLWVDFKRESVLIASFITSAAWKQLQFTLNNSEAQQGNTKITQGDGCLSYQIWISIGFAQKEPVKEFDLLNVFNKGLHGVGLFSDYEESTESMNLEHLSTILQKYLNSWFCPFFHHKSVSYGENTGR